MEFWLYLGIARMAWGTYLEPYNPSKSARNKVPQSARLSAGGGLTAIWAMPKQKLHRFRWCVPKRRDTALDITVVNPFQQALVARASDEGQICKKRKNQHKRIFAPQKLANQPKIQTEPLKTKKLSHLCTILKISTAVYNPKHRKNCECCPLSLFIVR